MQAAFAVFAYYLRKATLWTQVTLIFKCIWPRNGNWTSQDESSLAFYGPHKTIARVWQEKKMYTHIYRKAGLIKKLSLTHLGYFNFHSAAKYIFWI